MALGDANMRNLKRGEIIQIERKGYYCCDAPFMRPSKPVVLFATPDGQAGLAEPGSSMTAGGGTWNS